MELSIIIPVYNVEKYIAKCLESCLNQDLKSSDYEIVVVDDGSPDNSTDIVKTFQSKSELSGEAPIRLIHRENGGLSAARNTGLKEALGEYVWFVDSDDWIEPNVMQELLGKAREEKLDVLCFNLQLAFPDGHTKQRHTRHEKSGKLYEGTEFIVKVGMPPAAWAALYRREFLLNHDLKFYEGIIHEDLEFTPRAYCLAKRITYLDRVVYNYNQREGGIMKSDKNREKRSKDLLVVADSLYSFAEKQLKWSNKQAYWNLMNRVSFAFSQSLVYYNNRTRLSAYTQKPYYPLSINPLLSIKERWKYRLMNLSLSMYQIIYKVTKR